MDLRAEKAQAELELLVETIRRCPACRLAQTRTLAVPGDGPLSARVMFIGEAPGFNEDRTGKPFVGQAGMLLTELIESVGLSREEVYITNVVKCRPPNNRDPQPDEIAACSGYLDAQIALFRPDVVVTLGRFSMARYFPNETISRIHGRARRVTVRSDGEATPLACLAMYHPAAALHQPSLKTALFADIRKLAEVLDYIDRERLKNAEKAVEPAHKPPLNDAPAPAVDLPAAKKDNEQNDGDPQQLTLF